MRTLNDVAPTAEQLSILSKNQLGIEIIRGAAGSGKTTTALLRLRSLIGVFLNRRKRASSEEPVRILVLTYNRTLRGYINELASHQVNDDGVELEVSTFAKWARSNIPNVEIIDSGDRERRICSLGQGLPVEEKFLLEEVEYAMGRFKKGDVDNYLTARRDGRGTVPRVDRSLRQRIVSEVIEPYQISIDEDGLWDWNDFALYFSENSVENKYDIIIVDEAQDFSANQLRAVRNQLKDVGSITFVLDTAQRIYARGYSWAEIGLVVRPEQVHRLKRNYRNTKQTASLAASLIEGVPIDDDATMPDFSSSEREGPMPLLLQGYYGDQVSLALRYIHEVVDLSEESVAFLHPLGWFKELKRRLHEAKLEYVEMTRRQEWPEGHENIGLCTLHSAKGLEFDHVFILGLNAQVTQHGEEEDDDKLLTLRRLMAMGVGRARGRVIIGYKPSEASSLIQYFDRNKMRELDLEVIDVKDVNLHA